MKEILEAIDEMTVGETVIFAIWTGLIWTVELVAIVMFATILGLLIPHAPCSPRVFTAIQAGFAIFIILADRIDSMEERLYAWVAGYFLAYAVVGTRWFQGG